MLPKCSVVLVHFYTALCAFPFCLCSTCVNSTVAIGRWSIFLALKETLELFSMSWDQICFDFSIRWSFFLRRLHFGIYCLNYVNTKKCGFYICRYDLKSMCVYIYFFNCDTKKLTLSLSQRSWPCLPKTHCTVLVTQFNFSLPMAN